jgi:hypothetical protein
MHIFLASLDFPSSVIKREGGNINDRKPELSMPFPFPILYKEKWILDAYLNMTIVQSSLLNMKLRQELIIKEWI